jgi:hypothetical protein
MCLLMLVYQRGYTKNARSGKTKLEYAVAQDATVYYY